MGPIGIKELDSADHEYHPTRAARFGVNIMQMRSPGQFLPGTDGFKTLDPFTGIHTDAEAREILRQRSKVHATDAALCMWGVPVTPRD